MAKQLMVLALLGLGACGSSEEAGEPSDDGTGEDSSSDQDDEQADEGARDADEGDSDENGSDGADLADEAQDDNADGNEGEDLTGDNGEDEGLGDSDGTEGDDSDEGDDGNASCADSAKSIYLVDGDSKLWKFDPNDADPASSEVVEVGTLDCDQGPLDLARGVAIASDGRAWVLMGDFTQTPWQERLYTLDLATGKCGATTYQAGAAGADPSGSGSEGPYGMTMLAEPSGESLLLNVQARSPFKVMKLDPSTFEATEFIPSLLPADNEQASAGGQLVSTGDGKLYSAFWESPAQVQELELPSGTRSGGWPIGGEDITAFRVYRDIAIAASAKGIWTFNLSTDLKSTHGHYFERTTGERQDFEMTQVIVAGGSAPCASK